MHSQKSLLIDNSNARWNLDVIQGSAIPFPCPCVTRASLSSTSDNDVHSLLSAQTSIALTLDGILI
jgi:hypothetical protein